ncbi:MAG: RNA polymerase sigma factor [Limisphaerales bacterium]
MTPLEQRIPPSAAAMQPDQASAVPGSETMEELFLALESPLLSYALRLAGDLEAAEDSVQEAFMKLQAEFTEVREPRRWLYRTVHNIALNHRRQTGKIINLEAGSHDFPAPASDPADPLPLPDEQIVRSEGIGLVRLSLAALDERSRELIRLKFNEDLSYKEISQRTGLKTGHVGYLLHHALKTVAEELARNGVVP